MTDAKQIAAGLSDEADAAYRDARAACLSVFNETTFADFVPVDHRRGFESACMFIHAVILERHNAAVRAILQEQNHD